MSDYRCLANANTSQTGRRGETGTGASETRGAIAGTWRRCPARTEEPDKIMQYGYTHETAGIEKTKQILTFTTHKHKHTLTHIV